MRRRKKSNENIHHREKVARAYDEHDYQARPLSTKIENSGCSNGFQLQLREPNTGSLMQQVERWTIGDYDVLVAYVCQNLCTEIVTI